MNKSTDLYRRMIDGAPEAILFADREGVIRLWNAGAEAMFGYPAEEAQGQSLDLIIPERHRQRHWEGYRTVMDTGRTHYGMGDLLSVPALRRDGTSISCEFSIVMLHDENGSLSGIGAIMRDVSRRRQEEKVLKERLAALEKSLQKE